jgi:hypothetical protein
MIELTELFCEIDDFCGLYELNFKSHALPDAVSQRHRSCSLSMSEVMTICINFHLSSYRTFKDYYIKHVLKYLSSDFPNLVSYNRMVEIMSGVLMPCLYYLRTRHGQSTGISFVDSTCIPVCHPKRGQRNKVFQGLAAWGKSSMGWFFGFKLHLVISDCGEILGCQITPGNVDDRKPIPALTQSIFGKLFADKGYISQDLFEQLFERELQLITPLRSNMKNRLLPIRDRYYLRKRSLIETVNDQLKHLSYLVHSRHRSLPNFMLNLVTALIAYTHNSHKPHLKSADDSASFFAVTPL